MNKEPCKHEATKLKVIALPFPTRNQNGQWITLERKMICLICGKRLGEAEPLVDNEVDNERA